VLYGLYSTKPDAAMQGKGTHRANNCHAMYYNPKGGVLTHCWVTTADVSC